MKLKELIESVKEKNLTKDQLETYRDDLANIFALMHLELAEIEKEEALFFLNNKYVNNEEQSDISIKRKWKASVKGLRQIELVHYCKASEKILSSLKSRLYSIY